MKAIIRKVLPAGLRNTLRRALNRLIEWRIAFRLASLRRRMNSLPPGTSKSERLLRYTVSFHDGMTFYALYRDVFVGRIYHFDAQRPDPFILDCGSNFGGVILYFKHFYPKAHIIGFEADPAIFPYLQKNVVQNGLTDVQLVQAALAEKEGTLTFYSDGKDGSCLEENLPKVDVAQGRTKYEVPCVRLRNYLIEPVDFLKMNIEGAEWEVLADSEDRLRQVREMIIEYHHWPGLQRTLHRILELLHRQGFEYLIYDFNSVTGGMILPPFRLTPDTRYFLLIYAKRLE